MYYGINQVNHACDFAEMVLYFAEWNFGYFGCKCSELKLLIIGLLGV